MGIRKKTTRPREFGELGERVNAGASAHEKLQFVAMVNDDWTAEDAMRASTLKIEHSEIERRHAPLAEPAATLGQRVTWEE